MAATTVQLFQIGRDPATGIPVVTVPDGFTFAGVVTHGPDGGTYAVGTQTAA